MIKRQTRRVSRSGGSGMFLRGILLGMSGPGAFFYGRKRATALTAEAATVSESWRAVGRYLDRATECEREHVQKADPARKPREKHRELTG